MNKKLVVNDLIKWVEDGDKVINRVLWIDDGYSIAYIFNIFAEKGFPHKVPVSEILEDLDTGEAIKIDNDPFGKLIYLKDDDIGDESISIRDKAWTLISSLIDIDVEPNIYINWFRGPMVRKAAEQYKFQEKTVYKYLRKYWQRGKIKNALLPDFSNCGGKGKEKNVRNGKIGRPRKYKDKIGEGRNITDKDKDNIRKAMSKHYYSERKNRLVYAYKQMLKEYYSDCIIIENDEEKFDLDRIPSLKQFKYWGNEKERNIQKEIISRQGSKKYNKDHREVLGSSNTAVFGPGSVYQIDATVANVYLVSRYNNNWIIGRPVVYGVIDVFSRMVVGVYIGLEGPSWIGAMMALANTCAHKEKYCKEYGIKISREEWPCHYAPRAILGDKGEMISKKVETLIDTLDIKIQNTPSYRPDLKGIIEQHFETIDKKVKPFLPGYIEDDFGERGSEDYRAKAKLTIDQFTKIILKCILYHNNQHWLEDYVREEEMIRDNVSPIPLELWNWGISNKSGGLRYFPEDTIKLSIMPVETATVTSQGIKFRKWYYSCDKALKEKWFVQARNKKSWKIDFSYDPRNMDHIYIWDKKTHEYQVCSLLEKSERYSGKRLEEIEYLLEYEKLQSVKYKGFEYRSEASLYEEIEKDLKEVDQASSEATCGNESKSERIKGIRGNRKIEKEMNRSSEAFTLGQPNESSTKAPVIPINNDIEEDNLNIPSRAELLRRKQKEKLNGKRK